MKNSKQIKKMVGISVLSVILIVLQLIANYIQFGSVSITLALIPIVVGSILYGPVCGGFLGFLNGILVLLAPSTIGFFMPVDLIATIFICLLKTTVAGIVAGVVFKVLYKKNFKVAVVLASILVPIINTGLFAIGSLIFFQPLLVADGKTMLEVLLFGLIGVNFIIEFLVNSIASPTILYIVKIGSKNYDLGSALNNQEF